MEGFVNPRIFFEVQQGLPPKYFKVFGEQIFVIKQYFDGNNKHYRKAKTVKKLTEFADESGRNALSRKDIIIKIE